MAWVAEASKSISVSDWGPTGTDYAGCYAKATLTVSTSGNTVNYKVTMTTEVDGGTSKQPAVSLYLAIDGQVIFNNYWRYGETNPAYLNWPTKNGSSRSGSITTTASDDSSIPVVLKIATSQNGLNNSSVWKTTSTTLDRTWYTEVTAGKTYLITDNGNHTFTLWGYSGSDGTNNTITEERLWYAVAKNSAGDWSWGNNWGRFPAGASSHSLTLALPKTTIASVKNKDDKVDIVSCVETFASYGASKKGIDGTYKYGEMKVYARPGKPGKPVISYKKSRLTIKEDWTYTWTPATAGNNNSPVKGYRIRIYKNGTAMTGLKYTAILDKKANVIGYTVSTDSSNKNNYIDVGDRCNITFNPKTLGFKAGDTVYISIFSYSKNGKGEQSWSNNLTGDVKESYSLFCGSDKDGDQPVLSETLTVQNAGVVRIKVNGAWKEGQVHVKVNGTWKEADIVHTKVNGVWKESE